MVTYSEWRFNWDKGGELPAEEGAKVSYRVVVELAFPGEYGPFFLDGAWVEKSVEALGVKRTVEKVLASLERYVRFDLGLVKWWEWEEGEYREYEEVEEKIGDCARRVRRKLKREGKKKEKKDRGHQSSSS